ncbi:MMPL family transporter [Plantactinospora endophytica]|uniref:Membrane protein ActII-3 n=1 Tax=Plantactinospora endophytica TaxID=673535 RepID=A0ABQ4EFE4_9ACTN|nr:MMPL family transporter [Plantactinospora endophytica]GIG93380.1 putative membrane protein ActII-3 [Plantactinospora endophytica]
MTAPTGEPPDRSAPNVRALVGLVAGRRTSWVVLGFWLVAAVVTAGLADRLGSVQDDDSGSSLPAGAESAQVLRVQTSTASEAPLAAVVVYSRPTGLTGADRAKLAADARGFAGRADLGGTVVGPTLAADGTAARIAIPLDLGPDPFDRVAEAVGTIREAARRDTTGMTVYVTGPAGALADQSAAVSGLDRRLLLATVAVVVVILLVTYRSPVLWLLPVLCAGLALVAAQAVVYLLARYGQLTVTADSSAILTILVFGAATDYGLLLIARYREELRRHRDRYDAMGLALRRSAPAILASAGTAAAAMSCLLLADLGWTRGLGPVLAVGVLTGLVVMLTAFPALLVSCGRWVFWPARPRYDSGVGFGSGTTGFGSGTSGSGSGSGISGSVGGAAGAVGGVGVVGWWGRIGLLVARRPRVTWLATTLALGTLALGVVQLDATGLTAQESFRGSHESVHGERVLTRHFASGTGTPIAVVSRPDQAERVRAVLGTVAGVDPRSLTSTELRAGQAYLEAMLAHPAGSRAAYDTVDRVRAAMRTVPEARALVGGETAIQLDVQRTARSDRNLLMPIVFAVVFAILVLLLRSLVAPLLLVGTVVLSFAAALGASVLVFRYVFGFTGEDSSLPLYLFVFLVALGVDYNIFLMTRVREETVRYGTRRATLIGLAATGGVITSAGLVLAGTFAVLTTLPLTMIVQLGFAVAFGILLDTIVVRSVLVPALSLDVGRYLWWPHRLFRDADPDGPMMRSEPGTGPATPADTVTG